MTSGVYRAFVRDVRDPAGDGRIRVTIPAISGDSPTDWIYPVIGFGYWVTPKPGDQVWVLFEAGDEDNPVWLGATKPNAAYKNLASRVASLETRVAALEARL